MGFGKYLIANRAWIMFGFVLLCGVWALVWVHQGDAGPDLLNMGLSVGGIVIVWLIASYVQWRRLKP